MNLRKYECSIQLVEYGPNDYEYEGRINLIPNVVGSGKTYKEALDELYENLEAYLDFCNKNAISYPRPEDKEAMFNLSGRLTVRLPKSLHYDLNNYAKKDGMSINSLLIDAIREYLDKKQILDSLEDLMIRLSKQNKSNNILKK